MQLCGWILYQAHLCREHPRRPSLGLFLSLHGRQTCRWWARCFTLAWTVDIVYLRLISKFLYCRANFFTVCNAHGPCMNHFVKMVYIPTKENNAVQGNQGFSALTLTNLVFSICLTLHSCIFLFALHCIVLHCIRVYHLCCVQVLDSKTIKDLRA